MAINEIFRQINCLFYHKILRFYSVSIPESFSDCRLPYRNLIQAEIKWRSTSQKENTIVTLTTSHVATFENEWKHHVKLHYLQIHLILKESWFFLQPCLSGVIKRGQNVKSSENCERSQINKAAVYGILRRYNKKAHLPRHFYWYF